MRAVEAPSTQALRGWQRRALVRYLTAQPRDFLLVATPGAGKTAFALRIAAELLAEGTVETHHRRGAHRTPQDPVGGGGGAASGYRAGPAVLQLQLADLGRLPRRRGDLRPGGQPPDAAPGAHREPPDAGVFDEIHHGGDAKTWGDAIREAFADATRRLGPDRHPVPQRRQRHPVRHLRPRTGTGFARSHGRPHLRLLRRAHRRRGAPGDVPGLLRGGALAQQRRRGARRPARRAAERRADRPGLADRAGPGRRVDARGDQRGRHPAEPAARARHARRRRHGDRLRPDRRPRLRRRCWRRSPARRPTRGALRRPGLLGPDRRSSRRAPAGGWWRCGWSPRASTCRAWRSASTPPARRRRCSSPRPSAGSSAPARPRRDGEHLPAVGAVAAAAGQRDWKPSATTCWASRTARLARGSDDAELDRQRTRARPTPTTGSSPSAPTPNSTR